MYRVFNVKDAVDQMFTTHKVKISPDASGDYVEGIYTKIENILPSIHDASVHPLDDKTRQSIERGGQRLIDARKIYISDGLVSHVYPSDKIEIIGLDGVFVAVSCDARPERFYCKIVVSKVDGQTLQGGY